MKYLFVFALLIGSISATELAPEQASADPRFIDGILIGLIESLSQTIRDSGLDPLLINREAGQFALPVPELFTAAGYVESLRVIGISNIRVNSINFLITRLTFDIELPGIEISIGRAYGKVAGFGDSLEGVISGRVAVKSLRVAGDAHLSLLGGISLRSLLINFTFGGVDSNVDQVQIHTWDATSVVNNFLGTTIEQYLLEFRDDIDYMMSVIMFRVIENLLDGLIFARNLA